MTTTGIMLNIQQVGSHYIQHTVQQQYNHLYSCISKQLNGRVCGDTRNTCKSGGAGSYGEVEGEDVPHTRLVVKAASA